VLEKTANECRMSWDQKDVGIPTAERKTALSMRSVDRSTLTLAIGQRPHRYWTFGLRKREQLWVSDCFEGTPELISLNDCYPKRCKVSRISEDEIGTGVAIVKSIRVHLTKGLHIRTVSASLIQSYEEQS
jgi:hypothetical protein